MNSKMKQPQSLTTILWIAVAAVAFFIGRDFRSIGATSHSSKARIQAASHQHSNVAKSKRITKRSTRSLMAKGCRSKSRSAKNKIAAR